MEIKSLLSISRWLVEVKSPRYKLSRGLIFTIHFLRCLRKKKNNNAPPLVIWDIRSSSVTFDFLLVMLQVYIENDIAKRNDLELVIFLPSTEEVSSFKKLNGKYMVTNKDLYSRIDSMILPLASAFPFVRFTHVVSDRRELLRRLADSSSVIPKYYHPDYYYPILENYQRLFKRLKSTELISIPYLEMEEGAMKKLKPKRQQIKAPYATFTLRDYGWSPERNSTKQDVREFIKLAQVLELIPVIIPDDITNLPYYDIPKEVPILTVAREDIHQRYLAYGEGEFNVFTNGGPAILSLMISGTRTIIYNFGVKSIDASPSYLRDHLGLKVYDQPYRRLNGYIIWKQESIRLTTSAMLSAISTLDVWCGVQKATESREDL